MQPTNFIFHENVVEINFIVCTYLLFHNDQSRDVTFVGTNNFSRSICLGSLKKQKLGQN